MAEDIRTKLDPITVDLVRGALLNIGREVGALVERTAMAPFIREKKDYFCGVFNADGTLVYTQNDKKGSGMADAVTSRYPIEDMLPGDMYWFNDCYTSGGALDHLPDMCFLTPVFQAGEVVAFFATFGHFHDIGGMRPGSLSPHAQEISHEGLRIPPIRIMRGGEVDDALYRLILLNTRFPDYLEGDTRAMMAACQLGRSRLTEMFERYGKASTVGAFDELAIRSRRAVEAYLESSVESGTYTFWDYVDSDGVTDRSYRVDVEVTIEGTRISVDLTGSGDQSLGPVNFLLHEDVARILFARLLTWKDPTVLINEGAIAPIGDVVIRPGSLFSPKPPAPLGLRAHSKQRLMNSILGVFAAATHGETAACSPDYAIYLLRCRLAAQTKLWTDGVGVGQGARPFADGLDVIYSARGQRNFPVEFYETEFPVRILQYAIAPDSGGPGLFRGGCGVIRDVEVLSEEMHLATRMNGLKVPAWGVKGGQAGRCGRFVLNPGTPAERELPSISEDIRLVKGDVLRVMTSGGGGWGNPSERPPERVAEDVLDGFITADGARRDYGVALSNDGEVDWSETEYLRRKMPTDRPFFDRGQLSDDVRKVIADRES
jgi:N-methylhydantoinase B